MGSPYGAGDRVTVEHYCTRRDVTDSPTLLVQECRPSGRGLWLLRTDCRECGGRIYNHVDAAGASATPRAVRGLIQREG